MLCGMAWCSVSIRGPWCGCVGLRRARRPGIRTSADLPWPHYFEDLSGIGGSASPGSGAILLAVCAQAGASAAGSTSPVCDRPELVALNW